MLDNLELPQVQAITTCDRRSLAEHKPPGMTGSLLQNMGRQPTQLLVWGVASGSGADQFAQDLDKKFRDAKPVPFTSDIVADSKIDNVLIDDLRLQQLAGKPEMYGYVLLLREFIQPAAPEEVSALDAGILSDAQNLLGGILDGLNLAQLLVSGLERFVPIFSRFLDQLQQGGPGNP